MPARSTTTTTPCACASSVRRNALRWSLQHEAPKKYQVVSTQRVLHTAMPLEASKLCNSLLRLCISIKLTQMLACKWSRMCNVCCQMLRRKSNVREKLRKPSPRDLVILQTGCEAGLAQQLRQALPERFPCAGVV